MKCTFDSPLKSTEERFEEGASMEDGLSGRVAMPRNQYKRVHTYEKPVRPMNDGDGDADDYPNY